jgi:glycosyltransferase involved in cell wall biosynthesis
LFNFFSHKELALNVIKLLDNSKERARLGLAARKFAREKYDLKNVCLPRQFRWAEELNNKSG